MAATAISSGTRPRLRRRSELGLLVVGALVVIFAETLAFLGTFNRFPPNLAAFVLIVLVMGVGGHLANRWLAPEADPILLPVVLVLNGLGFVMIQRLAPYAVTPQTAGRQAVWSALGLFAYILTLLVIRRSRDLERYRYLLGLAALALLILPLVPGFRDRGADANGALLWVKLGPASFQPVEIGKLLLVIFFASYFTEKRELLSMPTNRVGNHMLPDLRPFGPIAFAWLASVAVIVMEKDIGFSALLFVLFITMLWVTTGRWIYLVLGLAAFALGTFVASDILHQVNQRIEVWLDPWKYATGPPGSSTPGYQPAIGEVLMGKGGATGAGLGLGQAPIIPVANSDFIFAAIGNELGLVGTTSIVVAFMMIVGSGLRIASRARSEFAKLTSVGLTVVIGFQAFFIMGGVTRLLPLTGVTLPFVSYGGSSVVANYILIALLVRISHESSDQVVTSSHLLVGATA
ncbi:MAG: FtsW/RodA/SpoVE family cell cycle protein [Acidimicrobiales bacterium]